MFSNIARTFGGKKVVQIYVIFLHSVNIKCYMDLRYHTSYSSINNEYSIIELPYDVLKEVKKQSKG